MNFLVDKEAGVLENKDRRTEKDINVIFRRKE